MENAPDYDGQPPAPPPRHEFLAALAAWQRRLGVDDDTTIGQLKVLVDPSGQSQAVAP